MFLWKYKFKQVARKLWPFVHVKKHEAALVAERIVAERRIKQEIEQKSRMIDDLLPKLMKIDVSRSPSNIYRLQIAFSEEMVREVFVHGNSQEAIRYVASRMGREIERELLTLNFARIPVAYH